MENMMQLKSCGCLLVAVFFLTGCSEKQPLYSTLLEAIAAGDLYAAIDLAADETSLSLKTEDGLSPILLAAREGEAHILESLIIAGDDLRALDPLGNSALHLAAAAGQVYTIEMLRAKGLPLELRNNRNYTAFHAAAEQGQIESLNTLAKLGANLRSNTQKETFRDAQKIALESAQWEVVAALEKLGVQYLLDTALRYGDVGRVSQALDKGPLLIESNIGALELPMLHLAVKSGSLEMIQLLVNRGADLYALDMGGNSAIVQAMYDDQREAVKLLLNSGVSINHRMGVKGTAEPLLHKVIRREMVDAIPFLLELGTTMKVRDDRGNLPLHVACQGKNMDLIRSLFSLGAEIDKANDDGDLPLHVAVQHAHRSTVELLLELGADIHSLDATGRSALHLAAAQVKPDIAHMLLERKAKVDLRDKNGATPLHFAAKSNNIDVMARMLDDGGDIMAGDKTQRTPLHVAAYEGMARMAGFLLDKGGEVNALDNIGRTPIFHALLRYRTSLARELMKRGADPLVLDRNNHTVLIALAEGELYIQNFANRASKVADGIKIMQIFLDKGLPLNQEDKRGNTVLHYAAEFGGAEFINALLERGMEINKLDNQGRTPLHRSAMTGNANTAKALLARRADPYIRDKDQNQPFHMAVMGKHYMTAKTFRRAHVDMMTLNGLGETLLTTAIRMGDINMLKALTPLVLPSPLLTLRDSKGESPMKLAVALTNGRRPVTGRRPRKSTLKEIQNHLYLSIAGAFQYAAIKNKVGFMKELVQTYPNYAAAEFNRRLPVELATERGHLGIVKTLFSAKRRPYNPRVASQILNGPAAKGDLPMVKYLIEECGVSYKNRGRDKKTPLEVARENRQSSIIRYIQELEKAKKKPSPVATTEAVEKKAS
jgi:ankyrin repeat protein